MKNEIYMALNKTKDHNISDEPFYMGIFKKKFVSNDYFFF